MRKFSRNGVFLTAFAAVAVAAVPAAASPSAASSQTSVSAKAADFSAQAIHRNSFACKSPSKAKLNTSWGDQGSQSVTVYFNNHCNQKRWVRLHMKKGGVDGGAKATICFMHVNPHTKGKKKIWPSGSWYVQKVSAPKSCEE
ncbi:hypothetical protein RB200_31940 [Streptomyces sp. PmtG]